MAAPSEQLRAAVVPVRNACHFELVKVVRLLKPTALVECWDCGGASRPAMGRGSSAPSVRADGEVDGPPAPCGSASSCGFSHSGTAGSAIESSAHSQTTYGLAGRCLVRRPAHGCKQTGEGKLIMRNNMTVEDAINVVHVLGRDLASNGDEDLRKLVSVATWLVSHAQEQAAELERERGRRHGIGDREAAMAEGHRLENGVDGGGRHDFLAARGVHAGETLYMLNVQRLAPGQI
jgi:hypothetical protein